MSPRAGPRKVSMKPTKDVSGRAQFVTDIGDEIGPHLLAAPQGGYIAHQNESARIIFARRVGPDRLNTRLECLVHVFCGRELDGLHGFSRQNVLNSLQNRGLADHGRKVASGQVTNPMAPGEKLPRCSIGIDEARLCIECYEGIGQGIEENLSGL